MLVYADGRTASVADAPTTRSVNRTEMLSVPVKPASLHAASNNPITVTIDRFMVLSEETGS
jgi:hypothetical protein